MIQNVGTDESEKHFRIKSVRALHPIMPVYFNILSPGIGTYSNYEIVFTFLIKDYRMSDQKKMLQY